MKSKKFFLCAFDCSSHPDFVCCYGFYTYAEARERWEILQRDSMSSRSKYIYFICSSSQKKNLPILPF